MTAAAVAAGLLAGPAVQAQEPDNVRIDVTNCVDLETPEARLACFEREVEAQRRAAPAAERAPAPPAARPPTSRPEPAPAAEAAPANEAAPVATESRRARRDRSEPSGPPIVAKVAQLRETIPNAWTITLDNDQVWRQTTPKWYALRPGMEVHLEPTRWGTAYRLTAADLSGFIQVERLR